MFTGEDVASSAHIGCELVDFIETAVNHLPHEVGITEITYHEVISFCLTETWEFEIGTSDPKAFPLQPPDKMVTDEATGTADQRNFSGHWFRHHILPGLFLEIRHS